MVDPANANELAAIAQEIGAEVLQSALRYPAETGGWQLGDLDLGEHLARYRDQRLVLVIVPLGAPEPQTDICSICGFVMNEVSECLPCKLLVSAYTADLGGGSSCLLSPVPYAAGRG